MYIQYNVNNSCTDIDTMGANINNWYHQDTSDFVKYMCICALLATLLLLLQLVQRVLLALLVD